MNEKIVNCDFVFKCPQAWDKMDNTETDGIRFCGECEKNVYFADSPEVLNQLSREGKCVAVWQEVSNYNNLQNEFRSQMTAGMPARPENYNRQAVIVEKSEGSPYWILGLIGLIIAVFFGVIFIFGLIGFFIYWLILRR